MIFSSIEFIFYFLPLTLILYFLINHFNYIRVAKYYLFVSSLFFYAFLKPSFIFILLSSVIINFIISRQILHLRENQSLHTKLCFILGLIFNALLLGYYKYIDFILSNLTTLTGMDLPVLHIALPLGISFFTLQQIAFLVDTYEGITHEKNFIDYALFVSFFPQLIAGPIVHHETIISQFKKQDNKLVHYENMILGLHHFALGLFKKSVIADRCSFYVDTVFSNMAAANSFEAWVASFAFTFQLYFDFSGYSDMAVGLARMFNINIPSNFNSPYKATNISEFWRRWHITLSSFITTYLYTPIVKQFNKITLFNSILATLLSMTIAGLWHGANWTYVVFGFLHGVGLAANQIMKKKKWKFPRLLAWVITFLYVNLTFTVFRANSLTDAFFLIKKQYFPDPFTLPIQLRKYLSFLPKSYFNFDQVFAGVQFSLFHLLLIGLALFGILLFSRNSDEISKDVKISNFFIVKLALIFVFSILFIQNEAVFLYFNF